MQFLWDSGIGVDKVSDLTYPVVDWLEVAWVSSTFMVVLTVPVGLVVMNLIIITCIYPILI